jgi:nickel/cobalt transporter (NicO) family protein
LNTEFLLLLGTTASIALVHTILGPDHYVPFVAMARARKWSLRRTLVVTGLCGIGHVTSSIIIGLVGLVFGIEVLKLTSLESARGAIAGWLLFGFGLTYMVWGIHRALRKAPVTHEHDGVAHTHFGAEHHHHDPEKANITPWVIFTIFVFGPCEPLIPLVIYPAARSNWFSVAAVALSFGIITIATMSVLVYASVRSLAWMPQRNLDKYSHAMAGFAIMACGAGVCFLGL